MAIVIEDTVSRFRSPFNNHLSLLSALHAALLSGEIEGPTFHDKTDWMNSVERADGVAGKRACSGVLECDFDLVANAWSM